MSYKPPTKIRKTEEKTQQNKFIQDAIVRGNMKVASIAKNMMSQYGVAPPKICAPKQWYPMQKRQVGYGTWQPAKMQIEDAEIVLKAFKKYYKFKPYFTEVKTLSRRKEKKYQNEYEYD